MNTIFYRFSLILTLIFSGAWANANQTPICNFNTAGYMADRFVVYQDGTARDKFTNLIWQRCSLGEEWNSDLQQCTGTAIGSDWRDIITRINTYNDDQYILGKNNDWRLPNIKELSSLTTLECSLKAIDKTVFPRARSAYWTSTPFNAVTQELVYDENNTLIGFNDQNMIWVIRVLDGRENWVTWKSTNYYALLVRGQSTAE